MNTKQERSVYIYTDDRRQTVTKVSVIIPVYNTIQYLEEAAESVLAQTMTDWEMILVDDGSTDGCSAMCDSYAEKDARIHVIHQKNQGVSAARNTGMAQAAGEYLQFLDSDDRLYPDTLAKCMQAVQDGAEIVIFDAQYEGTDFSFHEKSALPAGLYDGITVLRSLVIPKIPPYAWNKFTKRELYKDVQFPVGEKWEDVGTTYIPISRAEKIAVLGVPLYHYRQRDDAITKQAGKDGSVYYWRYTQYRKRYAWLQENYPELAGDAKDAVIRNAMQYYAVCGQNVQRTEVYRFLKSFRAEDIRSSKLRLLYRGFCILPKLTSCLIRQREHRGQ